MYFMMSQTSPVAGGDWTNVFVLDSMSLNATNDVVRDEQTLH
jgi:hypothetical protein